MNFACDACQKLYSIADEKVQGRHFRVTCKACGHVIVVKAGGQVAAPRAPAAAPPHPASAVAPAPPPPAAPPPAPAAPAPPAAEPGPAGPPPSAAAAAAAPMARRDDHDEAHDDAHERFFASEPAHRPREAVATPAPGARRRPLRLAAAGLALLLAAGGAGLALRWSAAERVAATPAPPPGLPAAAAPTPTPAPAAAPLQAAPVAQAVEAASAELPPEPPLAQKGALAPRGVGGRAGFEPVGGGATDDPRDRLRRQSLTIAKKDKRLLDLLGRKGDAAPAEVARTELDTGRGSLDAVAVRQTLTANASGFSACVTRAVKADPHLRINDRRATLNLTVKPSGAVSSAWISEADLDKSPLGRCLLSSARRLVFPAFSGEEVEVAAPLALSTTY